MAGYMAVGTAGMIPLPKKEAKKATKFHCLCMMESGQELYITVKAETEAEATKKVHAGYAVEFVLDTLTPLQLEFKKKTMRRSLIGNSSAM
jgi:DNA-dependent RNA polymerase auxiliary subunit epsilon